MTELLVCGDSWTFGSEIKDPSLPEHIKDWDIDNNSYRIPKIWPTLLADKLGITVTNISYPAASNDRIVRLTESWIYENYINTGKATHNLRVIVGWTSPERKDFFYTDPLNEGMPNWTTIWPNQTGFDYIQPGMNDFFKNYVTFLWSEREAHNRYVHQVKSLENLCKAYKIELLMFQAFYDTGKGIHGAEDSIEFKDIVSEGYINDDKEKAKLGKDHPGWHHHYSNELTKSMWESVDRNIFIKQSYFGFCKELGLDKTIIGQHPNEFAHVEWANYLEKHIKETLRW
ncbi:MAG: hypothetical protein CMA64_00560 [Euryarchaeota archaeon]|jgi:hypothetical protein|nr:hypothetical protein [Euryarchaeota archaeon]